VTVQLAATLGLHFTAPAQVQLGLQAQLTLAGLPLVLSPPASRDGTTQSGFALNLSNVQVLVAARPNSTGDLAALAGRLGLAPDAITEALAQTLQSALAGAIAAASPTNSIFPLSGPTLQFAPPGQDGLIGPSVSATFLTDAALVTRRSGNAHPATLCVLGDLFDRPAPVGSPQAKTAIATTDGAGAMILTAAAAERFVLCPSVFRALLPTYLNQVIDASVLRGIQPADVPGYDSFDPGYQQDIASAISGGQVGYFFDLVLPGGLPPASYRSALGETIFGQLPAGLQELLSYTGVAMAAILPSQCGHAASMPMPYSELTRIRADLVPGFISLSGVIEPSTWGASGQITFSATLYPSIQFGGSISLAASPPKIDSTLHLAWYAVLLGAIVVAVLTALTAITGGATAVGDAVAIGALVGTAASLPALQNVLVTYAVNAVTYQMNQVLQNLASPALPLPAGAVATAISVDPDGMILRFGVAAGTPQGQPPRVPVAGLTLDLQVTSYRNPGDSGTVEIDNPCVHGSFAYQDYLITTSASYTTQVTGLAMPVSYAWTVDGSPLPDNYGTLYANDPAYNMLYSKGSDGAAITLQNTPGSPSYSRLVQCVATGSDGISAEAARGALFEGFERDLDPAYYAQLAQCVVNLAHHLATLSREPRRAGGGTGTGSLSGQDLSQLILRLIPGGEWDPRAASQLGAALMLAGPAVTEAAAAAAVREALIAAGHPFHAMLDG
jgi:hypothetical protein